MSPSKTWLSTPLEAESADRAGFRIEASPMDALM